MWLITGASRGMGRALAEAVLARRGFVIAGCRDLAGAPPPSQRFRPVALDVTSPADCAAAVDAAVAQFGRLDVVANVAGVGLVGAVEETPPAMAREVLEVNFWGPVNVLSSALPVLRRQRAGHVIQISSLSGRVAAPGVGFYAASKFALEGLSEALHAELSPLGIHVTIVEPGGTRTDWAGSSLRRAPRIEAYDDTAGATRAVLERVHSRQPTGPEEIAAAVIALVEGAPGPRRAPVTRDAVDRIGAYLEEEREALARWACNRH